MNFEDVLRYEPPNGFNEGAIYWEFTLHNLKPPRLVRQGDTGYYAHDGEGGSKTFRFDDFERFREFYIVAHEENIRRLKENESPLLVIGEMFSSDWPPWQIGSDPCG